MTFDVVMLILSVYVFVVGIVWVNPGDTLGVLTVKVPVIVFGILCAFHFAKHVGVL